MDALRSYVEGFLAQQARHFLLCLDAQRRVVASAGDGAHYGLEDLIEGHQVEDELPFLLGLETAPRSPQVIPFWETPIGGAAHVHLMPIEDGLGLAFVDATQERDRQRRYQQVANELALLQHQRERLVHELEQSKAKLAEANRLKGLFIARMSHEFRTPISSILGYGDLLRERMRADAHALQDLNAIARAANYLLNMVENLLDQATSEEGELQLRPHATRIQDLVRELDLMFRPIADQKRLTLTWRYTDELPDYLRLDSLRLRQVIINLLGNALKFTHQGGVTVALEWQAGQLEVQITDTGPGISEAFQDTLFEPFRQEGYSKGAGLGLAISRRIVQRMSGEIRLQETSPGGTTMVFKVAAPALDNSHTES